MRDTPRWNPYQDFAPVILTNRAPNVLVAHPSVAAGSVKELVTLARAKAGQLNYGAGAAGASTHLAAELFRSMAGVNIARIPYKSSGAVINALMGNEVQIMFATVGSAVGHIKAGRLKGLAVATRESSTLLPGMPTVAADLPGYESVANYAICAPGKTPDSAIRILNHAVMRILARPEPQQGFSDGHYISRRWRGSVAMLRLVTNQVIDA
jgi:tripartite-type tricarboxylate transporter receptor subunit TctC